MSEAGIHASQSSGGKRPAERAQKRERRGREPKTAKKTGHTGNPGEKKRRRRGEGIEMMFGVEEVGKCPVDHVCVP